jgi:small neutral amino acid transporter SnatA (MarC family)
VELATPQLASPATESAVIFLGSQFFDGVVGYSMPFGTMLAEEVVCHLSGC